MADEGVKGVMMVDSPPHQPQKKSYFFSKEVQKISQFWMLTVWLLTFRLLAVYIRVFLTRFSGFVHF